MAVSKTGAMFKSLTFDGEDSRDYGVYITGQAVFNAPEREVEMISIPGRNGQFALDMGRFENIEVTYPAGIFANTEAEFAEAVSNFRNLLCSKRGYVRLQDDYNPNEYRMAVYKSGLELDPLQLKAGEFEITFDCKPQRYLTSGEEEITIGGIGTPETVSGEVVQIDNPDGNLEVLSLSVLFESIQEGSGTPSPSNVRPITGWSSITTKVADNYDNPTTIANYTTSLGNTYYGGTIDVVTGELEVTHEIVDLGSLAWTINNHPTLGTYFYASINTLGVKRVGDYTYTAYPFICSEYTAAMRTVASFVNNTFCFDGSAAAVTQLQIKDSSYADAAAFKTAMSGVQLVYELATPQTHQLTPQDIELLLGTNNVWSDGTITVTYAEDLSRIYNPTLFDAEPLLEVEGYGNIEFNGYNINLANAVMGEVEIVSNETMAQTSFDPSTETTVSESQAIPISDYANVGDDFTASFNITEPLSGFSIKSVKSATISTPSSNGSASVSFSGKNVTVKISGAELSGASNTDAQATASCTASVVYVNNLDATLTATISISVTLDYDATSQKTIVTSDINRSGGGFVTFGDTVAVLGSFIVDSTVSILGHPTYIDCELGECYRIENGTVISLNRYIDLGSDLPKLAPGGNEFTIDNTITELKVVPKWWKV